MKLLTAMFLIVGLCFGCRQDRKPNAYYGPTEPLPSVISQINQRNARIDSLWATGSFSADLIDPKTKKTTSGSGDLTLLFMPQRNLRLRGKVLTTTVFDIGSNDERYWLITPTNDSMYWGYYRPDGTSATNLLPVRPELLSQVLGVATLETDLLREPFPTLRFNNDADAYMITWQGRLADQWAVQKEVWYDRKSLLPRLVVLFDTNGRIVLRAYLSDVKEVSEGFDPPLTIPTQYNLFFPDSGSRFDIKLKDVARKRNNVPMKRTFNFPGERAGVEKVIQIDE